jgi:hypothetical protein
MKKAATGLLLLATLLVVTVAPCWAGVKGGHGSGSHGKHGHHGHKHHGHKHHGHGFRTSVVLGFGPAYWWWHPYPYYWYYPPPYYYPPPPPQEPPVYIEQSTQMPQASPGYWYYCQSASAYYPNVQSCSEAWIKVAPRSE